MSKAIHKELRITRPREDVWRSLTESAVLAEWMFPNDFAPHVGHRFSFRVPPNPKVGFDGMVVRCEVLECDPPNRLVFTWSAGGLGDTRVSFRLEPDGEGTHLFFEHSGFDLSQGWSEQAIQGADYGWAKMLKQLPGVAAGLAISPN
jgi:uncharacterized protein YndB with AHSA1/START domain